MSRLWLSAYFPSCQVGQTFQQVGFLGLVCFVLVGFVRVSFCFVKLEVSKNVKHEIRRTMMQGFHS